MDFRGWFQCALCEERDHVSRKKTAYKSHFPEKKIALCEECHYEFRTDPKYADDRPDMTLEEAQEIRKKREFNKNTRIYL